MTIEDLRQQAKKLPCLPGVYMMKDSMGNIIYVGKSKALKKRVSSYFSSKVKERSKIKRLVANIASFDYELTDTELDALLLECALIKRLKPVYNSLLKNDKRYRFIVISEKADLPRAEVAYEKGEEGKYFGPYDIPYKLTLGVEAINSYYKLPTCKSQITKQDCLAYLMNRCMGPCEGEGLSGYKEQLKAAELFLDGKDEQILAYYKEQMENAAQNLDFEKAVMYRDYLAVLKMLTFRKEAIQFTLEGIRGAALIKMPRGGEKLYLLEGTQIIFEKCFEVPAVSLNKGQKQALIKEILGAAEAAFQKPLEIKQYLEKSEVDSAVITYYFLKTKSESYYQTLGSSPQLMENISQRDQQSHFSDIERNKLRKLIQKAMD